MAREAHQLPQRHQRKKHGKRGCQQTRNNGKRTGARGKNLLTSMTWARSPFTVIVWGGPSCTTGSAERTVPDRQRRKGASRHPREGTAGSTQPRLATKKEGKTCQRTRTRQREGAGRKDTDVCSQHSDKNQPSGPSSEWCANKCYCI